MTTVSVRILSFLSVAVFSSCSGDQSKLPPPQESLWRGWSKYQIRPEDTLIRYGRELIENTSYYLGPGGRVASISNGMNCQNCHLDGGTVPWGNNYGAVVSTYPKFRARSGTIESIQKRVNDCLERSLNGKPLDTASREMHAIVAYFHWLGDGVPKGKTPKGTGIMNIAFLDRPADPTRGEAIYVSTCAKCHGQNGAGKPNKDNTGYTYPPLWGPHSFNTGAGLLRLSRIAGFIKNNMPFEKASFDKPVLTNEDAWDVGAYVISQPRPELNLVHDWPDKKSKPFDYPFAPYPDTFPEKRHKYGPFDQIIAGREGAAPNTTTAR
jgi:thiosulfate dehydrogenase